MRRPNFRTWWSDKIVAMRRDRRKTVLLGVGYLLGIGWLDYATGYNINVTVMYLTPLVMLTVAGGWRLGLGTALACALTTELSDYLAGKRLDHLGLHALAVVSHSLSYLSFLLLITQLLKLYDRERVLAGRDPLTSLNNRHGFLDEAPGLLQGGGKNSGASLVVWNMARLRGVNAEHGHENGDSLLVAAADALRQALPGVLLCRLDADRFAALALAGLDEKELAAIDARLADTRLPCGAALNPHSVRMQLPIRPSSQDALATELDGLLARLG